MAKSRVEQIMQANIDGTSYNGRPLSRVEDLFIKGGGGGGGGGTGPGEDQDLDPETVEDVMSVISTDNDDDEADDNG